MKKLSERINLIVDFLVEKVNSMKETADDCVVYTTSIAELYTILNQIIRVEDNIEYFYLANDKESSLPWTATIDISQVIEEDNFRKCVVNDKIKIISLHYNKIKLQEDLKYLDKYSYLVHKLEDELKIFEELSLKLQAEENK